MGQRAEGGGHGAEGMGQRAWGMEQGEGNDGRLGRVR